MFTTMVLMPVMAVLMGNAIWYLPPLAAVISLVYNASRFEMPSKILSRSIRLFLEIMIFMAIIMAVLYFLSFGL